MLLHISTLKRIFICAVMLCGVASKSVEAETLVLRSVSDGYIRTTQSANLANNERNHLFLVGDTAQVGDYLRSVLTFDLNRPELVGAKIINAELVLEVSDQDKGAGSSSSTVEQLNLHALDQVFDESTVDWIRFNRESKWNRLGGDFGPSLALINVNASEAESGRMFTLGGKALAAAVQASIGAKGAWLLKLAEENQNRSIFRFKSSKSRLVIDYEPSPAVAAAVAALREPLPGQPGIPVEGVTPVPGYPEAPESSNYYLIAGGHSVEVKSEPYDFDVVMFTMRDEPVLVDVMVQGDFTEFSVKPDRHNLKATRVQNAIRFTLDEPVKLVVQIPGRKPLAIIATPEEVDVPSPEDANVLYFKPGVTYAGVIRPQSGQTVYFAPGALVRGRIEATAVQNVKVLGRGILDTSGYALRNKKLHGILFDHAENIKVDGIGVRSNDTWWQTLFLNSINVEVSQMNLFGIGVNTDGVDIDAVKNFVVRDTFIRAEDDGLGWHSLDAATNGEIITENALAENVVIWNTGAGNGIRIGASMEAQLWRNITIRNVDILQHAGAGIYSDFSDWAWMDNLRFENIVIEKPSKPIRFYIDETRYSNSTGYLDERGHFDRLLFENVRMNGGQIRLSGYDATHRINGVRFNNCVNDGIPVDSLDQITVNDFVTDIDFNKPLPPELPVAEGTYEAEYCESRTNGVPQYIADMPNASHGRIRVFEARGAGDFIEHDLTVPSAGEYEFALLVRTSPEGGLAELSINGKVIGPKIDLYSSRPDFRVVDCGELQFGSAGLLELRLTSTGKHARSRGYRMELDVIQLKVK
ncbi:glycosyl hydrolase family 28 protein [Coraliomargarita algicola]|uniref:Glycosyl hydrolase family 28 protein n=1 Tax=Coraliomargarita algicola TaxID=3092156 RepID=A0ABZ0RJF8_9BACT|nr:glycosyl hydrolase family 28 protein [Coraliomargarita sp. J2-16]WPJ95110.1 glycosyl hydrolase family 28 protein [Coraliomargarita sp. J2-16]